MKLDGITLFNLRNFFDYRGFFRELFNCSVLDDKFGDLCFVQDNFSYSKDKNTIRGLHFQKPPFAQGKFVQCLSGSILDVVVDLRVGSPTYGKWDSFVISEQNALAVYIPPGFAHGFKTLVDDTRVFYKCTETYNQGAEMTLRWDDPVLSIDWGAGISPIVSEKDMNGDFFSDFLSPFEID